MLFFQHKVINTKLLGITGSVDRLVLENQQKMKFGHFKLIFLTYEKPTYKKPTYETPTYETPTYETPTYENFSIFFGQFHSHMLVYHCN